MQRSNNEREEKSFQINLLIARRRIEIFLRENDFFFAPVLSIFSTRGVTFQVWLKFYRSSDITSLRFFPFLKSTEKNLAPTKNAIKKINDFSFSFPIGIFYGLELEWIWWDENCFHAVDDIIKLIRRKDNCGITSLKLTLLSFVRFLNKKKELRNYKLEASSSFSSYANIFRLRQT